MLEKFLQDIGLNEKEAAIYLALLQVDNAAPADIATKTKIKRPTVYFTLESLAKKGLVSEVQVGSKTQYVAEPPERLETYVERQKTVFDERAARLRDVIPQLKSVQREQGERPVIKFFDGREGALSAYEEFYGSDTPEETGYFIYNRDLLEEIFSEAERGKFAQIREGKEIHPVTVYTRRAGDRQFETEGTRTRIDGEKYPILADITILGDQVIASTLGGRVTSVLIKSKDIAQTLASLIRYINDKKQKGGE